MGVTVSEHGLVVDGRLVPVYSGTVHYWRLERSKWSQILDRVIELGFGMIETYIPWSVHETSPGVHDFGDVDDRKDVEAFMALCEEKGLWLLVRPGPLINAELTDFGFPEWVLLDPEVQARTNSGSLHFDAAWGLHPPRPFPVPSYASEAFYEYVADWFDHLLPVVARHLAPAGCVVAVQSDNESCYLFHDQPYATDYSEASLKLYRTFLRDRYGAIDALNGAYRATFSEFDDVEPPRDCLVASKEDLSSHLDWVEYKEYQIRWSVSRIAAMMRDRGITDIPIFHDIAWQLVTPLDVSRMENDPEIDWVGINMYCHKEDYPTLARRIRFLAGATRLPFVPEFGCGLWSHHHKTYLPDDHEFVTLAALMNGLKAINFYMLVERERWQGSPITRHGKFRPEYAEFYQRLQQFLARYPVWEFEREARVLAMLNFDVSRHARMMTTLNLAHADLLGIPEMASVVRVDFGIESDPTFEADFDNPDAWINRVMSELTDSGCGYDIADTHIDPARLGPYSTVYLQTLEFMNADDQEMLAGFIEDGGTVVMGPIVPTLDPLMRPSPMLSQFIQGPGSVSMGRGRLLSVSEPDLRQIVRTTSPEPEYRLNGKPAEMSVLRRGDETLLFVANPTGSPVSTAIEFGGSRTVKSVWGADLDESDHTESLSLALRPHEIRIFDVTRMSLAGRGV